MSAPFRQGRGGALRQPSRSGLQEHVGCRHPVCRDVDGDPWQPGREPLEFARQAHQRGCGDTGADEGRHGQRREPAEGPAGLHGAHHRNGEGEDRYLTEVPVGPQEARAQAQHERRTPRLAGSVVVQDAAHAEDEPGID